MTRFPLLAAVWAGLLVAGFAVVITLGTPVASTADELNAAMHPPTPVSQADAERSAATIVRLGYPSFASAPHTTRTATDFGVEHWLVEYTDTTGSSPRGVRVSIVVSTGHVEVSAYP
jgi:hypothetical protein